MTAIGVFGGTFDPVHFGHLRSALEILQALKLDHVRLIPNADPPHRGATEADAATRAEMVREALVGQSELRIDLRELERDGPSFSVDTLESLREDYPDASLSLIVGMDAFKGLRSWHRWRDLFELAHVVVAHRPGWQAPTDGELGTLLAERQTADAERVRTTPCGHIFVHAVTQLEISATDIRLSVANGNTPRFLVPDAVCDLIARKGLYGMVAKETNNA